jgi:hypothetical protein
MAILYQHLKGKATPPRELNADLTPELKAIVLKAMAVDEECKVFSVIRQSV